VVRAISHREEADLAHKRDHHGLAFATFTILLPVKAVPPSSSPPRPYRTFKKSDEIVPTWPATKFTSQPFSPFSGNDERYRHRMSGAAAPSRTAMPIRACAISVQPGGDEYNSPVKLHLRM
jgi:hypothetical protein